ncbi:MAG: phenylalanine--tRNA ligase subunit beta [Thermoplasmata archaeon]
MVVVSLDYEDLTSLLGKKVPMDELEEAIPLMGASHEGVEGNTLRMEIDPDRPDLYSIEGLARALRGYLGIETGLPRYNVRVSGIDFIADANVKDVRPYVVGGLVEDLSLTEELVASIVELQERLHITLGRKRAKVAIGLHDFDAVEGPFRYRAFKPEEARFVPLGSTEEMSLGEVLRRHEKGREYAWVLEGKKRLPLILDVEDQVLSFPPIINGEVTALSPETKKVFIDVTGTDLPAVQGALAILITAMAERGGAIRSVTVMYPEEALETPDLSPGVREISLDQANDLLGLRLSARAAVTALKRMRLGARSQKGQIRVEIPAYRTDIMHEVDLIEDLAIGHGLLRFEPVTSQAMTMGEAAEVNEFTEVLRQVLVGQGLQEVRTLTFQDGDGAYQPRRPRLTLANPITSDLTVVRSSLLPSLLEILRLNRHRELPQRIFEIDDVVLEGTNRRRVSGALIHPKAGFTEVKGLVLGILRDMGLEGDVEEEEDENLLEGRAARPVVGGQDLGLLGELKPEVITAYELTNPVAVFEIDAGALFTLLER